MTFFDTNAKPASNKDVKNTGKTYVLLPHNWTARKYNENDGRNERERHFGADLKEDNNDDQVQRNTEKVHHSRTS